jgi:pimeloyl-ACP methyl ester carboxylesterase
VQDHYGVVDDDGPVIFSLHGLPSSRLEGAHLIAGDRPGLGLSIPSPTVAGLTGPPCRPS